MLVRNWMSRSVVAVPPSDTLSDALKLMEEHRIRRLPVTEDGQLVGIVTKSDLWSAMGRGRRATKEFIEAGRKTVREVMTPNPVTLREEDTLEHAAAIMLERRISGLPVLAKGRLVGVLTESDIFKAFVEILGYHRSGDRISFTLDASENNLIEMLRRKLTDTKIRSLVVHRSDEKGPWHVVARVRGTPPPRDDESE